MGEINMTKMYNRMYWNDIIQLIFSYTYITFALFNAFVLHNIQNGTTV